MSKAFMILQILALVVGNIRVTEKLVVEDKKQETCGTIFVGDSRTVGMEKAVQEDEGIFYVAKVGEGYKWLTKNAEEQVNNIIEGNDYDSWNIITNLGVNDLGNLQKYMEEYEQLEQGDWKEYNIYYVSINPVDEDLCSTVRNKDVRKFNEKLSEKDNYVNTYDFVCEHMSTVDGLHYKASLYQSIYSIILDSIK